MKKIDISLLARDLYVVSLKSQEEKIGGYDYSISLPEVVITPSNPSFSFDWSGFGSGFPDNSFSGGGGASGDFGNGGSGDGNNGSSDDDKTSISDPHKLLDGTKNFLKTGIDAVKGIIDKGDAPDGANEYLETLKQAQETLDKMSDSTTQKYRIDVLSDNGDKKLDAGIGYDTETGEIVLAVEDITSNNYSLVVHELTHIEQLMNGDLWIENGEITGYDINDEVEAYQNQHSAQNGASSGNYDIDGKYYKDGDYTITPDIIREHFPGMYDDLPNTDWSKPSGNGTVSPSASSASSASR